MTRRTIAMISILVVTTFSLVACGGQQDEPTSKLSQAERDSVLSESDLPGASAVKGAMAVSDSAKARAERAAAAGQ
jgi:hypothetical protein